MMPRSAAPVLLAAAALAACGALSSGDSPRARGGVGSITLPTGRRLDPAGRSMPVGNMPLGAAPAAGGETPSASGAASELIYRYAWDGPRAALADSISLRPAPGDSTPRFPAG